MAFKQNFLAKTPFQKNGFFKDLGTAIKSVPKAIKEGPIAHAKREIGKLKSKIKGDN